MRKEKSSKFGKLLKDPRWLWAVLVIFVIGSILLYISEGQFPTMPLSSGIVAFISAVIGVILTIVVTHALLKAQTDNDLERDKDVRIFQKKIEVYSEFTHDMWAIIPEGDQLIDADKIKVLRNFCFQKLVFYLSPIQVQEIAEQFKKVSPESTNERVGRAICTITRILQDNLNSNETRTDTKKKKEKEKEESKRNAAVENLQNLYKSFLIDSNDNNSVLTNPKDKTEKIIPEENSNIVTSENTSSKIPSSDGKQASVFSPTFWHFNIFGNEQIKALKEGNKVLNLIEYGEDWRTNALKQVKPDDVVFLFLRGGSGYVGAFRVVKRVIKNEQIHYKILREGEEHTSDDIREYDIYNSLADGATLSSNLFVEPIAYNFSGVGYRTVRRRTIERFVNDPISINYVLNKFKDVENKFDDVTPVNISRENQDFFNSLFEIKYLRKSNEVLTQQDKVNKHFENKNMEGLNIWVYENYCLVHEYSMGENQSNIVIDTYIDDNHQWKINLFDRQQNIDRIENNFGELLKKFEMTIKDIDGCKRYSTDIYNSDEIADVLIEIRKMVEVKLPMMKNI